MLATRLIIEGTAEYVSMKLSDVPNRMTDDSIPRGEKALKEIRENTYKFGAHLVKPIIDTFGVDALCYLYDNQPSREELADLKQYQERIMGEMDTAMKQKK